MYVFYSTINNAPELIYNKNGKTMKCAFVIFCITFVQKLNRVVLKQICAQFNWSIIIRYRGEGKVCFWPTNFVKSTDQFLEKIAAGEKNLRSFFFKNSTIFSSFYLFLAVFLAVFSASKSEKSPAQRKIWVLMGLSIIDSLE